MIGSPAGLDAIEADALRTDRYLEALLVAADRGAGDAPAPVDMDPRLRSAARTLRDELVRIHPSFRFEERLAQRLASAAARMRLPVAAGGGPEAPIVPFPGPILDDPALVAELANPELAALLGSFPDAGYGTGDPRSEALRDDSTGVSSAPSYLAGRAVMARQVLVGGALTSAALSLAGAAFVAWRRTRGAPADPMARAVRAAGAAREAGRTAFAAATAVDATPGGTPRWAGVRRTGRHAGAGPGRLA